LKLIFHNLKLRNNINFFEINVNIIFFIQILIFSQDFKKIFYNEKKFINKKFINPIYYYKPRKDGEKSKIFLPLLI